MNEKEFININQLIPDAIIELKYMTEDNFIGRVLYDQLYDVLRYGTLKKLTMAADNLRKANYRLIIWDAFRPLEVQRVFWEAVPDEKFVAHPDKGSKHNRGCAVDITIANMEGIECEMPTSFDEFSLRARADREDLKLDVLIRLRILQDAMVKAGFEIVEDEWWHFNDLDWMKYEIV